MSNCAAESSATRRRVVRGFLAGGSLAGESRDLLRVLDDEASATVDETAPARDVGLTGRPLRREAGRRGITTSGFPFPLFNGGPTSWSELERERGAKTRGSAIGEKGAGPSKYKQRKIRRNRNDQFTGNGTIGMRHAIQKRHKHRRGGPVLNIEARAVVVKNRVEFERVEIALREPLVSQGRKVSREGKGTCLALLAFKTGTLKASGWCSSARRPARSTRKDHHRIVAVT